MPPSTSKVALQALVFSPQLLGLRGTHHHEAASCPGCGGLVTSTTPLGDLGRVDVVTAQHRTLFTEFGVVVFLHDGQLLFFGEGPSTR